jgi:hypothetical protein
MFDKAQKRADCRTVGNGAVGGRRRVPHVVADLALLQHALPCIQTQTIDLVCHMEFRIRSLLVMLRSKVKKLLAPSRNRLLALGVRRIIDEHDAVVVAVVKNVPAVPDHAAAPHVPQLHDGGAGRHLYRGVGSSSFGTAAAAIRRCTRPGMMLEHRAKKEKTNAKVKWISRSDGGGGGCRGEGCERQRT